MSDSEKPKEASWAAPSPVEHGGRVELRLAPQDDGTTRYLARWFTADEEMNGTVSIAPEGTSVSVSSPDSLPEWLESFTTALVRTTARQAEKSGNWPRRLTRWRKAPEGKGD